MTKKLQELFEMPLSEDEMGLTVPIPSDAQEITTDACVQLKK